MGIGFNAGVGGCSDMARRIGADRERPKQVGFRGTRATAPARWPLPEAGGRAHTGPKASSPSSAIFIMAGPHYVRTCRNSTQMLIWRPSLTPVVPHPHGTPVTTAHCRCAFS